MTLPDSDLGQRLHPRRAMIPTSAGVARLHGMAGFLRCIHDTFAHDLRGPLGVIANYASALEDHPGEGEADVRNIARRIGLSGKRACRMAQALADASGVASRETEWSRTDLAVLARAVLHHAGLSQSLRLAREQGGATVEVDSELLSFVWRAFVVALVEVGFPVPGELQLRVRTAADTLVVDLCFGARAGPGGDEEGEDTCVDMAQILEPDGGSRRLERLFSLRLARCVVQCHGGAVHFWGGAGRASRLVIRLPAGPDCAHDV